MIFKFLLIIVLFCSSLFSQSGLNVKKISGEQIDELIQNRNDKLLIVNIWATWCIPCREEFPDLVKLYNEYGNVIDFIAISVDYEDEVSKKVIPFIENNNVEFPVYISGFKKDEQLIEYFNPEWNGALPATFIFDKSSNQIKFLEGKHTYDSFISIIKYNTN